MDMRKLFWISIGFTAVLSLILVLGTTLTYFLWNWLSPAVFGGPVLTVTQAMGVYLLTRVFFGSHAIARKSND